MGLQQGLLRARQHAWQPCRPARRRTLLQVNTHGSQNTYQFFMREGTALVEILPWNWNGKHCTWADQYFKWVGACMQHDWR